MLSTSLCYQNLIQHVDTYLIFDLSILVLSVESYQIIKMVGRKVFFV